MTYSVYQIKIRIPKSNDYIIYYGRTKQPDIRLTQHINDCYNINSKAYTKEFYQSVRKIYLDKQSGSERLKSGFKLIYIGCKTVAESKRKEMYLILTRWIKGKPLYQKIPVIKDF